MHLPQTLHCTDEATTAQEAAWLCHLVGDGTGPLALFPERFVEEM